MPASSATSPESEPGGSGAAAAGEPPPHAGQHLRIDALTGLRFLLALMVMLSHLPRPPQGGVFFETFLASGYSGVTVFFVLSGFVLTHNYHDRFARQLDLGLVRSYLVARLARIYPLYLALLVWVAFPALWASDSQPGLWFEHVLALQAWDPMASRAFAFNDPGWSVSVEVFLYCCFPLLVLALGRPLRTLPGTLVVGGAAVASIAAATVYLVLQGHDQLHWTDTQSTHRWLYRTPLLRLGDFVLGMVAARLVATQGAALRRYGAPVIALSAALAVALMSWPSHFMTAWSYDLSYAVLAASLIGGLALAPESLAARLLSRPWMVLLGEASYALYLCHYHLLPKLGRAGLPQSAWFVEKALTLLMIIAVSVGLHVLLERPARELLRRVLDARPAAKARPSAALSPARAPRASVFAAVVGLAALVPLLLFGVELAKADGSTWPDQGSSYENSVQRSLMLLETGRAQESLSALEQAAKLQPDAFAVHNNRCVAHGMLHQKEEAVVACRRALQVQPQNELAKNNLAWVESLPPAPR